MKMILKLCFGLSVALICNCIYAKEVAWECKPKFKIEKHYENIRMPAPALTLIDSDVGTSSTVSLSTTGLATGDDVLIVYTPMEGVTGTPSWPTEVTEHTNSPVVSTTDTEDEIRFAIGEMGVTVPSTLDITDAGFLNRVRIAVLYRIDNFDTANDTISHASYDYADPDQEAPISPANTSTNDDALAIAWSHAGGDPPNAFSNPTGWSNGAEYTTADTRQQVLRIATKEVATAGTTGTAVWDWTGHSGRSHAGILILESPSVANIVTPIEESNSLNIINASRNLDLGFAQESDSLNSINISSLVDLNFISEGNILSAINVQKVNGIQNIEDSDQLLSLLQGNFVAIDYIGDADSLNGFGISKNLDINLIQETSTFNGININKTYFINNFSDLNTINSLSISRINNIQNIIETDSLNIFNINKNIQLNLINESNSLNSLDILKLINCSFIQENNSLLDIINSGAILIGVLSDQDSLLSLIKPIYIALSPIQTNNVFNDVSIARRLLINAISELNSNLEINGLKSLDLGQLMSEDSLNLIPFDVVLNLLPIEESQALLGILEGSYIPQLYYVVSLKSESDYDISFVSNSDYSPNFVNGE